jgi:ribosomal protein L4
MAMALSAKYATNKMIVVDHLKATTHKTKEIV